MTFLLFERQSSTYKLQNLSQLTNLCISREKYNHLAQYTNQRGLCAPSCGCAYAQWSGVQIAGSFL